MFTSVNLNQREGENVSGCLISREVKQDHSGSSSPCAWQKAAERGMKNNSLCSKTMLAREKYQEKPVPNTARLENETKALQGKTGETEVSAWFFGVAESRSFPPSAPIFHYSNIPLSGTNVIIQGFN